MKRGKRVILWGMLACALLIGLYLLIGGRNPARIRIDPLRSGSVSLVDSLVVSEFQDVPSYAIWHADRSLEYGIYKGDAVKGTYGVMRRVPGAADALEPMVSFEGLYSGSLALRGGMSSIVYGCELRPSRLSRGSNYPRRNAGFGLLEVDKNSRVLKKVVTNERDDCNSMFTSVAQDDEGNVWLTGIFVGAVPHFSGTPSGEPPHGGVDYCSRAFLAKFSPDGESYETWALSSEKERVEDVQCIWDPRKNMLLVVCCYKLSQLADLPKSANGLRLLNYDHNGVCIEDKRLDGFNGGDVHVHAAKNGRVWITYLRSKSLDPKRIDRSLLLPQYLTTVLLNENYEVVKIKEIETYNRNLEGVSQEFTTYCNGSDCFLFAECRRWMVDDDRTIKSPGRGCSSVEMFVYDDEGRIKRRQTLGVFNAEWLALLAGENHVNPERPFLSIGYNGSGVIWSDMEKIPVPGGKNVLTCVEIPVD